LGDLDTSPARNTQTQAAELAELRRGERATWGPRPSNPTWGEERPNWHTLSKLKRWVPRSEGTATDLRFGGFFHPRGWAEFVHDFCVKSSSNRSLAAEIAAALGNGGAP
jgi:hypothetical protein